MAANMILKRGFSVSSSLAAAQQSVKVPVQVHGVEGRYASALYTAAYKQKSLDAIEKDLSKVKGLYESSQKFKVCFSPICFCRSIQFSFLGICS